LRTVAHIFKPKPPLTFAESTIAADNALLRAACVGKPVQVFAAKALAELITPITAKVVIICFMIYIPRIMIKIA
jgi:hypothetical protein